VSDAGERYAAETQRVSELQHFAVTQGLKKRLKDTQWTFEQLPFVAGHKSVSTSAWHDFLLKFGVRKVDRAKIMKNLG
jgi:hypothetical protein